jgi:hypothetical protein
MQGHLKIDKKKLQLSADTMEIKGLIMKDNEKN